ncbi:hypothetical protein AB1Y20_009166 [Prymnesium parvum]|uniref:Uncharacterized protein n=1 Tax=Prymnesium parvum TaxID=97485 RepID=A0AB34K0L4_PRYPA
MEKVGNFFKNVASSLLDDQEHFTDLTQVSVVDVDACLSVLSRRYDAGSIYTNCGPLLVAVNPYRQMDELYSHEQIEHYMELLPSSPHLPHVFEMAARVYRRMMASGRHQAVVISGESGAGKTETAKLLLQYFAFAASAGSPDSEQGTLRTKVMGTNPIMESLGCAQTVRNDNSSRFGKLVLIDFTKTGRLASASMKTYLLEKSRVANLSVGECTFHAFYESIAGLDAARRRECAYPTRTNAVQFFHYLKGDGATAQRRDEARDSYNFDRAQEAMAAIGLDEAQRTGISFMLAGILHLGNIDFGTGDVARVISADSREALNAAARLLQCDPTQLQSGMCTRRIKAGAEWVTSNNSAVQASEVRHGLSKQLYSAMFAWMVNHINQSLSAEAATAPQPGREGPHIAYVDIFGFEIFKTNSLEQLCINFTNEKLQRLFTSVLFDAVAKQYQEEGIEVEPIAFNDNKGVVQLIGAIPAGLLSMLSEECVFPKGSDTTYLQKVCNAHRKSAAFQEIKTSSTAFGVRHFAGEVVYTVTGFLEKNKDPVSQDLQVLMQYSESAFVSSVMRYAAEAAASAAASGGAKGSKLKSGKFRGVIDNFLTSLRSLMDTLQEGELYFIRCIKPNDTKTPGAWDRSVANRQLTTSGIVQAVATTRAGYTDHLPPAHIVSVYSFLAPEVDASSMDLETAAAILQTIGVAEEDFAVGKTKVFLRQGVLAELEIRRMEFIGQYAARVQAAIRGMTARSNFKRLLAERRRKEEERAREAAARRAEQERLRRLEEEQRRAREEEALRREKEELERRKQVQKARSLSFDKRRKKKEAEEIAREESRLTMAEVDKRADAEARKLEAEARQMERLKSEGVSLSSDQILEDERRRAEERVASAEAAGRAELSAAEAALRDSPEKPISGGFQLKLPTMTQPAPPARPAKGPLDEIAKQFVCPIEDILAYADMIGMDVVEDMDLLWIADEALQAPEPEGWEERQDPRGGIYYVNSTTDVVMLQHPVDYHYQQFYLQLKMQKKQQAAAARSGNTPRGMESPRGPSGTPRGTPRAEGAPKNMQLDLRSVSADHGSEDESKATPRGWLSRKLLTPRGSPKKETYECIQITVEVFCGDARLGLELNAYNQILSILPGSPCERHPEMQLHDRILEVDGEVLGDRLLTDVIKRAPRHTFVLERWVLPGAHSKRLSPRTLLSLGKSRATSPPPASSTSRKAGGKKPPLHPASSLTARADRFTVLMQRGAAGLGIVLDEDSVVVDMVPGGAADAQRHLETRDAPRLQIGDRIVCVDGVALSGRPLEEVIQPAMQHTFLLERLRAPPPAAAPSPRGLFKSPRAKEPPPTAPAAPAAPSRALRQITIFKESEDQRLGIRFVRDDEGFDVAEWGRSDVVLPIVAALDPNGDAARAGIETDDMVLSINGQTGLSNTQAAAQLRELTGTLKIVVRRATWRGTNASQRGNEREASPMPETPRSAMRRLV